MSLKSNAQLSIKNISIPNKSTLKVAPKSGDADPLDDQARADREQNRKLKENVKKHIVWIIWVLVIFTIIFFAVNTCYRIKGVTLYSEYFLGVLLGSQLLFLPLSLLTIITRHLFPNN